MGSRIDLDVAFLEQQIAELIREYPDLADDEALKSDVLEGKFDVESVLSRVLSHLFEADAMLDGMKGLFDSWTERKKRWERRKEFCRSLAQRVLEASGRDKITLPEASVSRSVGRDSVEIVSVDDLPQGLYAVERKPDKKAIAEQLKAGEELPGARMVKGAPSITVRTK